MCPCGDSTLISQVTIGISKGLKVDRHNDTGGLGSRIWKMKTLCYGTI